MDTQTIVFVIVAALVSFGIGLSKGGLGGSLGALATPVMALVLPPEQVVGLLLPVLIFADFFAVAVHWQRWEKRHVLLLLPSAILGVTVATLFITQAPTGVLKKSLGVLVLLFVLYRFFEARLRQSIYKPKNWHGLLAGSLAGFTSTLAHSGGPPVNIYLLLQNSPPPEFVATTALFFAVLNWVKVPYYYFAGLFDLQRIVANIWMFAFVPLGVWSGRKLTERIEARVFERVITLLLVVSAVLLLA